MWIYNHLKIKSYVDRFQVRIQYIPVLQLLPFSNYLTSTNLLTSLLSVFPTSAIKFHSRTFWKPDLLTYLPWKMFLCWQSSRHRADPVLLGEDWTGGKELGARESLDPELSTHHKSSKSKDFCGRGMGSCLLRLCSRESGGLKTSLNRGPTMHSHSCLCLCKKCIDAKCPAWQWLPIGYLWYSGNQLLALYQPLEKVW